MSMDRKVVRELEALYRARYRQFLRVATAIVGDEAAAHDAVQDAFARALRSATTRFAVEGTLEAVGLASVNAGTSGVVMVVRVGVGVRLGGGFFWVSCVRW